MSRWAGLTSRVSRRRLPDSTQLDFTPREPVRWYSWATWWASARSILQQSRWQSCGHQPNEAPAFTGFDWDARDCSGDSTTEPAKTAEIALDEQQTFAIDYIADLGDGFHAGFSVLHALANDKKRPPDEKERHPDDKKRPPDDEERPPGQLLILGGDQVYPTPTPDDYKDRLEGPIKCALPNAGGGERRLYSIPGNHDYYDELAAFKNALQAKPDDKPRTLGAYTINQRHSFWVLRLPGDWLFIGVDFGVQPTLPESQTAYILKAVETAGDAAKCVLIVATPAWLYGDDHPATAALTALETSIRTLAPIEMVIAGDRHCYIRHDFTEERDDNQPVVRLTAGGGGSFSHLGQAEPKAPIINNDRYLATAYYPKFGALGRMGFAQPVNFVVKNLSFMGTTGLLALLGAWLLTRSSDWNLETGWRALYDTWTPPQPTWSGAGLLLSLFVLAIPPDRYCSKGAWRTLALLAVVGVLVARYALPGVDAFWNSTPTLAAIYLLFIVLAGAGFIFPPPDVRGLSRSAWRIVSGFVSAAFISFPIAAALKAAIGALSLSVFGGAGDSRALVVVAAALVGAPITSLAVGVLLWIHAQGGVSSTAVYGGARRHDHRSWLRMEITEDGLEVTVRAVERVPTRWKVTAADGEPKTISAHAEGEPRQTDVDHFLLPGDGTLIVDKAAKGSKEERSDG